MQHDLAKYDADCLHGAAPACRGGLAARELERKQEREGVPVNNTWMELPWPIHARVSSDCGCTK
jgi:hypothetical protein